ncbi:L-tyrosine/L-tryptophan isonitrile synthase family protein [bacterium]|nr:L-tyrosine/L-tryptophan isonitrile synthase family protein [bacterium]
MFGFPFKIPLLLKTNRTLPDLGELLSLKQLVNIAENIKRVYPLGAKIYIFTEGGFGKFVGVSKRNTKNYQKFLVFLSKKMGFDQYLEFRELSEMEKDKNFKKFFQKNLKELKRKFQEKDKEFIRKYQGAKDSIFRIINPQENNENILMEVYNQSLKDSQISPQARKVRERIRKKLPEAIISYFAYLKTRDDLNFLEKVVPHFIPLSVSPKPNRLGIIPIERSINKLPYHSVPVFWKKKKKFSLEYLIDIKRSKENYIAVYLKEDRENCPFYYKVV